MSMVRCNANKHFYDNNVHSQCPYCTVAYDTNLSDFNGGTELIGQKTTPFLEDQTELLNDFGPKTEVPSHSYDNTVRIYDNDGTVRLDEQTHTEKVPTQETLAMTNETPVAPRREPIKTKVFGFGNTAINQQTVVEQQTTVNIPINSNLDKLPVTGWLVVIDGPGVGLDFRLIQGENRIGRDKEMEICLDFGDISDDMISRDSHAIVVYDNHANVFFVERGRSRNMPLLNDRTIRSGEDLKAGDIIQVGKTKLMLISFCNESFKWG